MITLHHCVIKVLLKCCWQRSTSWTLIRLKSSGRHPTAGIIVIGNEILKAQVKDTNCSYACNLLYKHGVKVQKVAVIRDDLEDIAKEIKDFSKMFNYVFTSGGIGPTHDDVTYEATALAFNDTLHYHPTLVDIIENCFNCGTFPSPAYKMAHVPTKSVLKFGTNKVTGEKLAYPCVVIENVYILPGSPMFFETSFQALCKECFASYKSFATTEVYINAKEESFARALYEVTRECPNVTFGSYPESNRYYKARVTIESEDEKETERAKEMFCDRIPRNVVIHYDRTPDVDCVWKYERLIRKLQDGSVYERSLKKFVHYYEKPEEVWIYFDGSEESVIMLHLARIAGNKLRHGEKLKLHAICFKSDIPTLERKESIHELEKRKIWLDVAWLAKLIEKKFDRNDRYNIELYNLEYKDNDAAWRIKDFAASKPELKVLLLGKRLHSKERETYNNVARLNENGYTFVEIEFPLIDWTDEDVEKFSSFLFLPYYRTQG